MRRYMILFPVVIGAVLLFVLVGLTAGLASSQSDGNRSTLSDFGSAFTYQGYLTQDGAPADGLFDFEFALYDVDIGGSPVTATLTLEDVC